MPAGPSVSVIVPAKDAASSLPGLLDALAAQTVVPAEVIVVDDASTDATAAAAASHPIGARVVAGEGKGSYAARNVGLSVASGVVVAFTDADCRPAPTWLEHGVRQLRPDVILGGRIWQRRRDGAGRWERYDRATYLDQENLVAQGFAATANLLTHRETLRGLGGFDASFRSSGDHELGRRARAAGIAVAYAADVLVEHEPRTTAREVWQLHRRLGTGWRQLARGGAGLPWWRDPALRVPLGHVVERVAADGPPLRRRHLAPVHLVAMTARWRGRLLG